MLATILKLTQLQSNAFKAKPKNLSAEEASRLYWKKSYQALLPGEDQLAHIFTVLEESLKQLGIAQGELKAILESVIQLERNCQTESYQEYLGIIKGQLETITWYLTTTHSEKRVDIAFLLLDACVCAEGCLSKLEQIIYLLDDSSDIYAWLADLRLHITQCFYYTQSIKSIHTFNGFLNYTQEIGINAMTSDELIQYCLKNEQHLAFISEKEKQKFISFFSSQYTVENIVQGITERLKTTVASRFKIYQEEISPWGLVISNHVNANALVNQLADLPINGIHSFIEPVSEEDDSYYQLIKSTLELKTEVAEYLRQIGIFEGRSKKIKLGDAIWEFTIIEGDRNRNYGFISRKNKLPTKEIYPLDAFETEKFYQHCSLKTLRGNKDFLLLGQNAFEHFYKLDADFSDCYLKEIDCRNLNTEFLASQGLKNAYFIRPTLTYEQFLITFAKDKAIARRCVIDIKNAKQFFKIIELLATSTNQKLFLERHRELLLKNSELLKAIFNELNQRKINLQKNLKKLKKRFNDFKIKKLIATFFLSDTSLVIYSIATIIITIVVIPFLICIMPIPLYLFGATLAALLFNGFLLFFSEKVFKQLKVQETNFHTEISASDKKEKKILNLENRLTKLKDQQLLDEVKLDTTMSTILEDPISNHKAGDKLENCYKNPSSVSSYFLKKKILPAQAIRDEDSVAIHNRIRP